MTGILDRQEACASVNRTPIPDMTRIFAPGNNYWVSNMGEIFHGG